MGDDGAVVAQLGHGRDQELEPARPVTGIARIVDRIGQRRAIEDRSDAGCNRRRQGLADPFRLLARQRVVDAYPEMFLAREAIGHGEIAPSAIDPQDPAVTIEQRDVARQGIEQGRFFLGALAIVDLARKFPPGSRQRGRAGRRHPHAIDRRARLDDQTLSFPQIFEKLLHVGRRVGGRGHEGGLRSSPAKMCRRPEHDGDRVSRPGSVGLPGCRLGSKIDIGTSNSCGHLGCFASQFSQLMYGCSEAVQ
ncbi:MAG TPA: hypothetical protein VFF19_12705 [Reyranella sp.]|nr:hypothetical protein [Reyranella sp.]